VVDSDPFTLIAINQALDVMRFCPGEQVAILDACTGDTQSVTAGVQQLRPSAAAGSRPDRRIFPL